MRARVVVQVVAILVGAACTALAGWMYSDASSAWQKALQQEVDRAGVLQDDVRQVYANEGPFAFRVAALQIRAAALAPLAGTNAAAATEKAIAENAAFAFRQVSAPQNLAGQRRYDLSGGGSNLLLRLADVGAARQPAPDPGVPDREGDDLARLALWISVVTALVTGLAVVGATLRRSARPVVELYPQPGIATGPERRVAMLLLVIWSAGVLLPLVQLAFSSQEQRYQAESARHAVQSRSAKSISSTRTEFGRTALQIAAEGGVAATARELDVVYEDERTVADARELARAEEAAAARSAEVATSMARDPAPADKVEADLAAALVSEKYDWDVVTAQAAWETRKADAAGLVSNTMLAVIGLVVLAEAAVQMIAERRKQAAPPLVRNRQRLDSRALVLVCLALLLAAVITIGRGWRARPARAPARRPGT